MTALVSVVVTAFNKAPYLEQAVKSVLAQTYTNVECIIIDDGSTDYTADIAQTLVDLDARVQYFYKPNGGISSARNAGIQHAQGEWIQFLDADDWIHPDKIEVQLSHARAVESAVESADVVVYSDYQRVYFNRQHQLVDQKPCIVGDLTAQQLIERLLICPDRLARSPFPLLQQAMLFKKQIFQRIQFNEDLRACEDRALVLELLLRKTPFVYVPMIGAFYRKHSANLTDNDALMRESYIQYFNLVYQQHKPLLPFMQTSVHFLINRAIADRDTRSVQALSQLTQFPLHLLDRKLTISSLWLLRLAYSLRQLTPNFLLYEQHRGPRSKKLIAALSQLRGRVQRPQHYDSEP
ncbi:glycosyltransferase family 2 protein [Oculatella sp. LEGE 06141]|uniref:glycosyltransferase family 2 protein n=1 Tax=Oculatella sp. LEGE 06141 TaxID=1828648 RepID=UPI0018804994|nr:glycosyltransferase family 2 protein [Oculatella sp. LEGE 06141]MBE9180825.1 glycosyltransferase family 2 protein [Oculatella sp. LEGE 06141]